MAGEALFITPLTGELRAPDLSLALLLGDELLQGGEVHDPRALDLSADDEPFAREARDVVRRETRRAASRERMNSTPSMSRCSGGMSRTDCSMCSEFVGLL
jgi:hypothetical protein